jgi:AcrR family transcriptional regulator
MSVDDHIVSLASVSEGTDARHDALLDAAVRVFARYGFRKTSMDEVARAAGVSRQGLYLQFIDKEGLFRKAVAFKLGRQLSAAVSALADERAGLAARLVTACDEWAGRYVGAFGGDAADLMCASTSLAGATLAHYEAQFEKALAHAIGISPLTDFCRAAGIAPLDVARVLHATVRGLKHTSKSRQEFVQGMTVAAHMFCAPVARQAALKEL